MRFLFVMDPISSINAQSDTTLVFIEEALRRGHEVDMCEFTSLGIGTPTSPREVFCTNATSVTSVSRSELPCICVAAQQYRSLSDYGAVFMRKDPPFDLEYYFSTLVLENARHQTLLINDPRGLREANEKLYIFEFAEFIAPTCVTRSLDKLRELLGTWGGEMIVKPLNRSGGAGIFHVRREDRNTNAILETSTDFGRTLVMAQQYLPAARLGDKRILLLDGEPIGAVLRVPREDETRGNLHVGGRAVQTVLTPREQEICRRVGPHCKNAGLYFVGLDVIGDYLTEVNVTSPTGIQEINRLEGICLEAKVIDWVEHKAKARTLGAKA